MDHGIFMIQDPGHVQCFLVCGQDRAVLIDTGVGFCDIRTIVRTLTRLPVFVVNTHWHFDHIGGNRLFNGIGIARCESQHLTRSLSNGFLKAVYLDICLSENLGLPKGFDPDTYTIPGSEPSFVLTDNGTLDLGGRQLQVMATPGHTQGSLSFMDSLTRSLFCGDLVYKGTLYSHLIDSDLLATKYRGFMPATMIRFCPLPSWPKF